MQEQQNTENSFKLIFEFHQRRSTENYKSTSSDQINFLKSLPTCEFMSPNLLLQRLFDGKS